MANDNILQNGGINQHARTYPAGYLCKIFKGDFRNLDAVVIMILPLYAAIIKAAPRLPRTLAHSKPPIKSTKRTE